MSGTNSLSRLLSIRDKRRVQPKHRPDSLNLFTLEEKPKRLSKDEERKIQEIAQRLSAYGVKDVPQQRIEYALRSRSAQGDPKEAFKLLMLYEDSVAGVLRSYDPSLKLLGAENREKTTCYLDSLLFAMFAKSDVFEAILFNNFSDEPRRRLVIVMRLWVNMLRTGRLVTSDIIARLQESLAECGWTDAAKIRQQDASEAFAFITDKLELPLLTLKTDLFHSGSEDVKDDHKFITERMLDVALPESVPPGETLTLEMCLEEYFNNRVEVKRHLQRRGTADSLGSRKGSMDKLGVVHVETVEVNSRGSSPAPADRNLKPSAPQRPLHMRARATSVFSERKVPTVEDASDKSAGTEESAGGRARANSVRKEVLMPAWQFLNLIPWYADNSVPENDAQVRQHFSTKRPMLGICLKRYAVSPRGVSHRLSTHIDIPVEMACPHFDWSAEGENDRPPTSNFKLSLQSVVCHRGHSVDAGHYVSLVRAGRRATAYTNGQDLSSSPTIDQGEDEWLLFDDLAQERVRRVDINRALREESPYLLFYRVKPIDDGGTSSEAPPPYEHSDASFELVDEKLAHLSNLSNASAGKSRESIDAPEWTSRRGSVDPASPDDGRGRSSMSSARRSSIQWQAGTGTSLNGSIRTDPTLTEPTTPLEEMKSANSTTLSRVSTKGGRSDPPSRANGDSVQLEKRFSVSMSKITSRLSKERNPGSPDILVDDMPEDAASGRTSKEESPADTLRSKAPKEKKRKFNVGSRRGSGNHKAGKQPDRDCVIM